MPNGLASANQGFTISANQGVTIAVEATRQRHAFMSQVSRGGATCTTV